MAERRHNVLTDEVISLRKEKAALTKRYSAELQRSRSGGGGGAVGDEISELRQAVVDKDAKVARLEKEIGEEARNRH